MRELSTFPKGKYDDQAPNLSGTRMVQAKLHDSGIRANQLSPLLHAQSALETPLGLGAEDCLISRDGISVPWDGVEPHFR
jgi:hypothetical protein